MEWYSPGELSSVCELEDRCLDTDPAKYFRGLDQALETRLKKKKKIQLFFFLFFKCNPVTDPVLFFVQSHAFVKMIYLKADWSRDELQGKRH